MDIAEVAGHILIAAAGIVEHIGRLCPNAVANMHHEGMAGHDIFAPVAQVFPARLAVGVVWTCFRYFRDVHLHSNGLDIEGIRMYLLLAGEILDIDDQDVVSVLVLYDDLPVGA